jgi:AAA domain
MTRPPRSSSAAPSAKQFTLANVVTKGQNLPSRAILHATEGWGKTSFAASAKDVFFLQTRGETGLETLIDAQQLPEVPHLPAAETWDELTAGIEMLLTEQHTYRTLAIDTLNGAERLCHEFVCEREFQGDWSDKGFMGYMRGYEVSLSYWREFLSKLDRLRTEKRMAIMALCHTAVRPFRNPEGADYDRYSAKMHEKTWALSKEWADLVLFGHYSQMVIGARGKEETDVSKRGKAVGGAERILLTTRTAAFDAKNRLGLPEQVDLGSTGYVDAYQAFIEAIKQAREAGRALNNG